MLHHKNDFSLEAAWTFSASGHGKGPCDGVGATVKATATRAALQGRPDANFRKALDFRSFTFDVNDRLTLNGSSPIETSFLPKERVEKSFEEKLDKRWKNITVNGKFVTQE